MNAQYEMTSEYVGSMKLGLCPRPSAGRRMFGFFDMMDNYEKRKIENTVVGEATIDTCAVSDSEQPFETGIIHPRYNDGELDVFGYDDNVKELSE